MPAFLLDIKYLFSVKILFLNVPLNIPLNILCYINHTSGPFLWNVLFGLDIFISGFLLCISAQLFINPQANLQSQSARGIFWWGCSFGFQVTIQLQLHLPLDFRCLKPFVAFVVMASAEYRIWIVGF